MYANLIPSELQLECLHHSLLVYQYKTNTFELVLIRDLVKSIQIEINSKLILI